MDEKLKANIERIISHARAAGFAGIALDLEEALRKNKLTQIQLDNAVFVAREELKHALGDELQSIRLDGLDPSLTDYLVHDGGVWGRGKCLTIAKDNMPGRGRILSKTAQLWRLSANTRFEEGRFPRPKGDPAPLMVDFKTGLPVPAKY
ncbi:hypothetical protein HNP46_000347 [Pseudomonas nitritireducens]|uniref:Uncharacterized protein n=1 Tax=Pseudomonas nitroreducens TaxID=46680 RepID=A0A7W7KEU2_PSENT|nr:hypothetical protein [Pseudomonas nitritireducens]MBB4861536.1 hypothetical protein [Pseudomonas nitritireducens]